MKIQLNACEAQRPDQRAIAKALEELAMMDAGTARENTEYLLEGEQIEIEILDKNASSAYRTLRKLQIDYDLLD